MLSELETRLATLAERFTAAAETGDLEAMRDLYAPEARIWTNVRDQESDVAASLRSLEWFSRKLPDRRYEVRRRADLPNGYLQQHRLTATFPTGERWAVDACVVVTVEGERIVRVEEYFDSAAADRLKALGR